MSAYVSLLTTPFLSVVAENTSQRFKISVTDDYSTNVSLFPQNIARIVNKKVKKQYSVAITTNLFITTGFLVGRWENVST